MNETDCDSRQMRWMPAGEGRLILDSDGIYHSHVDPLDISIRIDPSCSRCIIATTIQHITPDHLKLLSDLSKTIGVGVKYIQQKDGIFLQLGERLENRPVGTQYESDSG